MAKKKIRDIFLSLVPVEAKRALGVGCGSGGLFDKLRDRDAEEIVEVEKLWITQAG